MITFLFIREQNHDQIIDTRVFLLFNVAHLLSNAVSCCRRRKGETTQWIIETNEFVNTCKTKAHACLYFHLSERQKY
jgi:hypothetical protein